MFQTPRRWSWPTRLCWTSWRWWGPRSAVTPSWLLSPSSRTAGRETQWRGDFSLVFTDRNVQDFNFNFPPTLQPRTEEYVHLKDLSEGLGDIQRELYHKPSDQTLLETILGLINTSKKLEDRLRILFEAGYKCPAEIEFIKSSIMWVTSQDGLSIPEFIPGQTSPSAWSGSWSPSWIWLWWPGPTGSPASSSSSLQSRRENCPSWQEKCRQAWSW